MPVCYATKTGPISVNGFSEDDSIYDVMITPLCVSPANGGDGRSGLNKAFHRTVTFDDYCTFVMGTEVPSPQTRRERVGYGFVNVRRGIPRPASGWGRLIWIDETVDDGSQLVTNQRLHIIPLKANSFALNI